MGVPRLVGVVVAAICGLPCLAAEMPGPAPVAGQRVFVTAHSFHIFVADRLAPLAKAAGITGHELVGKQMLGGSRVRQHWDLADEGPADLDLGGEMEAFLHDGSVVVRMRREHMVEIHNPHEPLRINVWERAATWGRAEYR